MPIKRQVQTGDSGQGGFTLVELMVVVAVIAILAVVAAPGMTALINANRVSATAGELTASLQLARSEAIRRNARVSVCAGSNGACTATTSWATWTVFGKDNVSATDDVIRDDSVPGSVQLSGPSTPIVFQPSGLIAAAQQLEVVKSDQKRCLTVLISGVVSVKKDACS